MERGNRRLKQGKVISNKMDRTIVVSVERTIIHPTYGKVITRNKKYYADDPNNQYQIGDQVTIIETRPLSKLKRWRVLEEVKK
jgi:small subunit ribosomal protein S17